MVCDNNLAPVPCQQTYYLHEFCRKHLYCRSHMQIFESQLLNVYQCKLQASDRRRHHKKHQGRLI